MGAFAHIDVGTSLSKTEWEAATTHRFASAAAGDIGFDNGTNFTSVAIGSYGQMLIVNSGATAPEWSDALTITNDGTKTTILGKTGDYTRIGDAATTAHSLASEDDLMVSGKLEVQGHFYPNTITLGGAVNAAVQDIGGLETLSRSDGGFTLRCQDTLTFQTDNAASAYTNRLALTGSADLVNLTLTSCYLVLMITDVDSATEAAIWYDASENKLKFYNGTAVETITSS